MIVFLDWPLDPDFGSLRKVKAWTKCLANLTHVVSCYAELSPSSYYLQAFTGISDAPGPKKKKEKDPSWSVPARIEEWSTALTINWHVHWVNFLPVKALHCCVLAMHFCIATDTG